MSVELARRLLTWGVPPSEVEAALLDVVRQGVSLVRAVAERSPELLEQLEREIGRLELPSIEMVRASPDIAGELPPGLCERLVAVPVHRDPRSGRVDVAAVDALDPHIQAEFTHHLSAPVRVLRARYAAVMVALSGLRTARNAPPRRKASVTVPPPELQPTPTPTEPPLALVKKQAPAPADDAAEPVLNLTRPKAAAASAEQQQRPAPAQDDTARVMAALEHAVAPEEVLELCCTGLEPMLAVALATKGSFFEARAASTELRDPPERLRKVRVPTGTPNVIETALRQGFYLGTMPTTFAHDSLRELFPPSAEREVYVAPVAVLGRASVVLVVARLGQTTLATRRVDEVAAAVGQALERIVRNRKRGTAG